MAEPSTSSQDNDLRDRILSAARTIFLDGPPESATMDAVAQTAGMSKKTIYREFKSQLELLGTLFVESTANMADLPPPTRPEDIETELSAAIVTIMNHILTPRSMALMRLIVQEVRRYPELLQMRKDRGPAISAIAKWLDNPLVHSRYLIEDPEDTAAMLLGMVMQDAPFKQMLIPTKFLSDTEMKRRADKGVAIMMRGMKR